jgi:fucose permease
VVVLGIFLSSLDVAMNAHAVAVERNLGKPIMSSFHALFSIGGIFGAAVGALLAWMKVSPEPHFVGMAITLCVLGSLGQRWLLPASADATHAKISNTVHLETLQCMFGSKFIFAVSVILFCCFLVEGAIGDWSGVYLRRVLLTSQGFAALGYAAFSVAMCTGRLTGDIIIHKCGRLNVVRFGSLIAIAGLALVVTFKMPALSLLGFSLIGIGVSNIVPIGFTAAGNSKDVEPGKAIATVSLMGYVGLLIGPPLIGFTAEVVTLRVALGILGITMIAMLALSRYIGSAE